MIKRLILSLFLCLIGTEVLAQEYNVPFRPRVVGNTYADILLWLNFEANDNTGDYDMGTGSAGAAKECSSGDTTGTFNDNIHACTDGSCVQAGSAKNGSYGYHIDGNNTNWLNMNFDASTNIVDVTSGSAAFWYQTDTASNNKRIFMVTGSNTSIELQHAGTSFDFNYDNNGVGASALPCSITSTFGSISAATWYFIHMDWNATTDVYHLSVTPAAGGTTTNTLTGQDCTIPTINGSSVLALGQWGSDTAIMEFDNLMVSDSETSDLTALRDTSGCPR